MRRRTFLASGAAFAALGLRAARADGVGTPMLVENNRIYVRFDYPGAGGRILEFLTNVDTGGGGVMLARKAVEQLALTTHSAPNFPAGLVEADLHEIRAGSMTLQVPFAATTVAPSTVFHPGASAPAFLPGAVLSKYAVTFDYTGGQLIIDSPELMNGIGTGVQIGARTAFPRIELEIDGERFGFLLDTGASFSMLSQAVIDRLRAKHPEWRYIEGAYGPANMLGKPDLAAHMLQIPIARWGAFDLRPLNVVSRAGGTFENWMSGMMSAPIVGAIAGNVLRNFTLRLNYPQQLLDVLFTEKPWPQEFTIVPLILQPERDGTYTIAGGTASSGIAGEQIVAVDGLPLSNASLYDVQELLRGAPGSTRLVRVRDARGERSVRLRVEAML